MKLAAAAAERDNADDDADDDYWNL